MGIEAIIQGCKRKDRKAQESLVQEFAPRLFSVCKRYCSQPDTARDALQETFLHIFKYIDDYSHLGSFEGWMRRIAVTASIRTQKKIQWHFAVELEEKNQDITHTEIPDVYAQLGEEALLELIKSLPKSEYLVFNLYVIEGYSHKEIGEILSISESYSRSALTRARSKLIQKLNQEATALEKNVLTYLLTN